MNIFDMQDGYRIPRRLSCCVVFTIVICYQETPVNSRGFLLYLSFLVTEESFIYVGAR
jgi:hypothetical protein